jgi:predicted AlkP superfamily phosphohydrolase/phosphomutase
MVYFDELSWRAAGTPGWQDPYLMEDDTAPDDAVHDFHGCYVLAGAGVQATGRRPDVSIYDVAPTMLTLLGVQPPPRVVGRPLAGMRP